MEVEVPGRCGPGAAATLRLRSDDGRIEIRFEVDHTRPGVRWQAALVHERRVAWKGVAQTSARGASFEVERTVIDLPGTDAVTARAWGPRGLTCQAAASLP